jgi:hypothetical protein
MVETIRRLRMRLITRGDMDGLTCYVLLSEMEDIEDVVFVHPKDMQDGKWDVGPGDIIANLPYHKNCSMWFDHHVSELRRLPEDKTIKGKFGEAASAAQLIYEYYDDPKLKKFERLVEETNKMDSAQLDVDDVLNPMGYSLLFYTIDPRTGLGAYKEYFMKLGGWIKTKSLEEILEIPEVKKRTDRVLKEQDRFLEILKAHSRLDGNVIITDLRGQKDLPAGNRFLIYTLYPHGNVSVRIFDGREGQFVAVAVAHNIFNKTCNSNIGQLLSHYGGGGHVGAGTVQFPTEEADEHIGEIIGRLKSNG